MQFQKTTISGVHLITQEPHEDFRGFFSRMFCTEEFKKAGIDFNIIQINNSYNHKAGTIRGIHYQKEPHGEDKLFRCITGEVYDVVVDMRPNSPTYKQWEGFHFSSSDRLQLFVPKGCANGYQALQDGTEMIYAVSTPYFPGSEAGIRWNDPLLNITWPISEPIVTEKDNSWENI